MSTNDSGLALVDKPAGWSSHQAVGKCRRLFGTRKVGHAGTLDPMATGLLIIGVNRATRLLGHLALHDKAYDATVRLGQESNTDDAMGEITAASDASHLTDADLVESLGRFAGRIMQVPSTYSAIKVDGKRAYALARAGKEAELAAREIEISELQILDVSRADAVVDVSIRLTCSTGTYVRALARDWGRALGVGGHLTSLRRTRIGPFHLPQPAADISQDQTPELIDISDAVRASFSSLTLTEAEATDVRFGRKLHRTVPAEKTAVFSAAGEFLALYRPDESGTSRPIAVFAQ